MFSCSQILFGTFYLTDIISIRISPELWENRSERNLMEYKLEIRDGAVGEKKIHNYISKCRNISDVRYFLQRHLFVIEKSEPPFGELRTEHLIKALEIAEYFNDDRIIAIIPYLKEIYAKIFTGKQIEKVYDNNLINFYKIRFPNLQFDDSGWKQIIDKINLETFIGIDIILEQYFRKREL